MRKLLKPAGRFCVDILTGKTTVDPCGYREYGGLEVLSRWWSNGRLVGWSVLGGLEEVEGGGWRVVGKRKKEDDESEVRQLEVHWM